jgi:hypothetical protein
MGVADGELHIPTIVLLYGLDIRITGSLSLAVSCPRCWPRSPATAATPASSSCADLVLVPILAALLVLSAIKMWNHGQQNQSESAPVVQ